MRRNWKICKIAHIHAREVLDSRGRPTVETEVRLQSGHRGRMIAPSGASTGRHEALELRDGEPGRFAGLGVRQAVRNVNETIAPALLGWDAREQQQIDALLCGLDGTENKSRLGANAILSVSVAIAKAAAAAAHLPLFRYLGGEDATLLPLPMVNMISGGLHAGRTLDMQDFLIIPVGADSFPHAVEMVFALRMQLQKRIAAEGYPHTGLADEGGFGPPLPSHEAAFELLLRAVEDCRLRPGEDVVFAIDVAASHFYKNGKYHLQTGNRTLDAAEMTELLSTWVERYPLVSIEDGLAEDDWAGWQLLHQWLGNRVQLIGDDLLVTHPARLQKAIDESAANAILIKMNQIGTLTETLAVLEMARAGGFAAIVSARSGETEDTTIADLAVATGAGQIKIGSLATAERTAKYNQLLRIEEMLGSDAQWPETIIKKMRNRKFRG